MHNGVAGAAPLKRSAFGNDVHLMKSNAVYWILRCANEVLTLDGDAPESLFPFGVKADFGDPAAALDVGTWQGKPCLAADVESIPEGVPGTWTPVRSLYARAGDEAFSMAARATASGCR